MICQRNNVTENDSFDVLSTISYDKQDLKERLTEDKSFVKVQKLNKDIFMHPIQEDNEFSDNESQVSNFDQSIYSASKYNSLALLMEKKDNFKKIQTLRQIHKSKLKLQKKMITTIAESMTNGRVDILKDMFQTEMLWFMKQ